MTDMREGMDYCRVEVRTEGENTIWDIFNYSLEPDSEHTDRKQFTNYSPSVQMTYEMGGWTMIESSDNRYVFEKVSPEGEPAKPQERTFGVRWDEPERMEEGVDYCYVSWSQGPAEGYDTTHRNLITVISVMYYDRHSRHSETYRNNGDHVVPQLQRDGWILDQRDGHNYFFHRKKDTK